MKKYYFLGLVACALGIAAESFAAPASSTPARRSTIASVGGSVAPAGRMAATPMKKVVPTSGSTAATTSATTTVSEEEAQKDMREKERLACTSNNVGMGNTFVWASRLSNIENYSSMIEDTDNPENNVCYVRVELKSNDSRISVSDLGGRYFEMGRNITCGGWVNEEKLQKRILDAKKTGRTWATIGGAVGGAGIGVGAMELFGNKLIGGKVQGQKALEEDALFESQLLVLKKDNNSSYQKIIKELKTIKQECDKVSESEQPDDCKKYDYNRFLATQDAK